MSCDTTWHAQHARLRDMGLRVHEQPALRDVDTIEDARAVALEAPGSRFAATLASIERQAPGSRFAATLASIER